MYNGTLIVLGFNIETPNEPLRYTKLQNNFPTELDLCGLIKFGEYTDTEAHLAEIIKDIDITDNPILLKYSQGAEQKLQASIFKHGQLQVIEYDVMSVEELYSEFFFCRLIGELDVFCACSEKSVHECMVTLRKKVKLLIFSWLTVQCIFKNCIPAGRRQCFFQTSQHQHIHYV
jgi:Ufm1-specific protease 2